MFLQAPNEYKPTAPRRGRPGVWYWVDVPAAVELDLEKGAAASHTVVTVIYRGIHGELLRWVSDGEIGYDARISGLPDPAGISDIDLYEQDTMDCLAAVAIDLRYEWRRIFNDFPDDLKRPEFDPLVSRLRDEVLPPVEEVDD
jgi:hypothetical protein